MSPTAQSFLAQRLLDLHHQPRALLLPNAWDPLSARMVAAAGYPAVATASAAIAMSLGYRDGENLRFDTMLERVGRIAQAVEVPVTADIERGYAGDTSELRQNAGRVFEAGVVGVNLEDSLDASEALRPIDEQCARIAAVVEAGTARGFRPVVNARCDAFLVEDARPLADKVEEAIVRGRGYAAAGAACLYPILLDDLEALRRIRTEVALPINVLAHRGTAPVAELESAGIARISLGPALMRTAYTAAFRAACSLFERQEYEPFLEGVMTSADMQPWLATGREV